MTRLFRASVALLCGLTLYAAALGDSTRDTPRFLLYWLALAGLYIAVLFLGGAFRQESPGVSPRDLRWALAALTSVRVVMAFGEPVLSDDVYRSVWEGRVQRASGNPFAWSDRPEAEKWAGLRDGYVYPKINHPDYAAIYPPAWQWAMRGVNVLSDSVTAVKLFVVFCELLFWLGLWRLLETRGVNLARVLIAAASPLAMIEIAGGGHNEAMGMTLLVWAMVLLERQSRAGAAGALALAVLAKLIPAILALPWLRRFRIRDVVLMSGVALLLSASFVDGTALWSLRKYGDYWRFNETFFALFAGVSGSHRAGVLISAAVLVALGLWLARRETDIVRAGLLMSVALILVMPNVLPWYALWLLVFVPVTKWSPVMAAAFVFTLSVPLAYLVYPRWLSGGAWYLPWSIRAVEYGVPLLVGLVVWRWRAWRVRGGEDVAVGNGLSR